MKLTEKSIRRADLIPADAFQRIYFDASRPNFGLKVMRTGARAFVCRVQVQGKRVERTLGRAGDVPGAITVHEAWRLARTELDKAQAIRRGEAVAEAPKPPSDVTIAGLVNAYIAASHDLRPRTRELYQSLVEDTSKGEKPKKSKKKADAPSLRKIGKKRARDVSPGEVENILNAMVKDNRRYAALNAARVLRAAWNWGAPRHGLALEPPTSTWKWPKAEKRMLKLNIAADLPAIWKEVQAIPNAARRAAWITMLLTGARPSSVLPLTWDDVNVKERTVTFREAKGGKPYAVPVGPYLGKVLADLKAEFDKNPNAEGTFVFPAHSKVGHVVEERDKSLRITASDARKIYQTLAAIVAPGHSIRLLVNHRLPSGDVASHYIQFQTEPLRPVQEAIEAKILETAKANNDQENTEASS